jgi:hypothetical protein
MLATPQRTAEVFWAGPTPTMVPVGQTRGARQHPEDPRRLLRVVAAVAERCSDARDEGMPAYQEIGFQAIARTGAPNTRE